MATMHVREADMRRPEQSQERSLNVEGPIRREPDGSCYCQEAQADNPWLEILSNIRVSESGFAQVLAEHLGIEQDTALRILRGEIQTRTNEHYHIIVRGHRPEAGPRYYGMTLPSGWDLTSEDDEESR